MADDDGEIAQFKTEYAKSSRSSCYACKQTIEQGELRFGVMEQSQTFDGKIPRWHHMTCFEDRWLVKHPGKLASMDQVSGTGALKFDDQKRIQALCTSGSADNAQTKPQSKEEKALEQESRKLHEIKDALRQHCSNAEIKQILEHNGQPFSGKVFGGEDRCLLRCADGMMFGAMPKCDECGDGDFIFTKGKYVCTGHLDEFTRCSCERTEVSRTPWKIPEDLKEDNEYLAKYKYAKRTRIKATLEGGAAAAAAAAAEEPEAKRPRKAGGKKGKQAAAAAAAAPAKKGPFSGMVVGCAGRTARTPKEIQDLVEEHGGRFTKQADFDYLITSHKDAAGKSKRIVDGIKAGKVLVTEGWLDSVIHTGGRVGGDELKKFCLANMPKEGAEDKDALREERKRLADAALVEAKRRELEALKDEGPGGAAKSAKRKPAEKKTLTVKGGAAVDEDSGLVDCGTIYSPKKGEVYSVTMNKADVATGQNSFYILQLIKHDGKEMYSVFRKWGKIGTPIGADKLEDYPLLSAARRTFETHFQEKTGNTWAEYLAGNFAKKPGRFMVLDVDYEANDSAGAAAAAAQATYQGDKDQATQNLMTLLFDIKEMEAALMQMEIDTQKMPLGKLSKATLTNGLKALTEIAEVLKQNPDMDALDPDERRRVKTKLAGLSNRFYTYIPHTFDEGEQPALIDTPEMVQKKNELVSALREMEVATSLMQQQTAQQGEHPIDANYKKLKCDFTSVPKGAKMWKLVDTYLQNTHASTHSMYSLELVDLWEIDREGEDARFAPHAKDHNRQLLWHGSRLTNWVGIISQGLRIAPPEAPATGYMFGKGIYFADMSSKSANYCFTTSEKTTGLMMLSEVALGDMFECLSSNYITKLPAGKLSCKGVGTTAPDPAGAKATPNGTVVPCGKGKPSGVVGSSLRYNEYIVYDVSQVRMRYLLRVNFKYKTKCGSFF